MTDEQAPRALLEQGFAALNAGDLHTAGRCCQTLISCAPRLPQAHFLVGLVALEARDRKTAFRAFASVTQLAPGHAAAWAQLARLLLSDGQFPRADQALATAIEHAGDDPIVLDLIGSLLSLSGEYDRARAYFERAVANAPKETGYLLNLANNRIYFGEIDAGIELLDRLLKQAPNSPQARWIRTNARAVTDASDIDVLRHWLQRTEHPRGRAFYLYAIGKAAEDLKDWSTAGRAFVDGAAERRKTVAYDEAAEVALFHTLERRVTRAWKSQVGPGCEEAGPVFILGQPRTGTTLIERVITAHSAVHSAGELQQLPLAVRRLANHRAPERYSAAFVEAALAVDPSALGKTYLATAQRARGSSPRFVDKLPQNYLLLPLINQALPQASIVHLQRDPADACVASFKQLFADAYLHSYDLGEMARHHIRYRRLMECWHERFSQAFIDVRYEHAAADLAPQARRLIDHLGLPWEDACLRFYEQPTAVATASAVQVRQPVHTRSVGRWRRYAEVMAPLFDTLADAGLMTAESS
ncbi:MAG: sulfotransferase [Pseudomonadota bacterium]